MIGEIFKAIKNGTHFEFIFGTGDTGFVLLPESVRFDYVHDMNRSREVILKIICPIIKTLILAIPGFDPRRFLPFFLDRAYSLYLLY